MEEGGVKVGRGQEEGQWKGVLRESGRSQEGVYPKGRRVRNGAGPRGGQSKGVVRSGAGRGLEAVSGVSGAGPGF